MQTLRRPHLEETTGMWRHVAIGKREIERTIRLPFAPPLAWPITVWRLHFGPFTSCSNLFELTVIQNFVIPNFLQFGHSDFGKREILCLVLKIVVWFKTIQFVA